MKANSKASMGLDTLRQIATTIGTGGELEPSDLQEQLQQPSTSSSSGGISKFQAFQSNMKRKSDLASRVVPLIQEPDSTAEGQEGWTKKFEAVSVVDIFNLSDGDDEEDEDDDLENNNSNSIKSPGDEEDDDEDNSKASVIHRMTVEPEPSNQVVQLSTVNEKNHTEIEPGGTRREEIVIVAEIEDKRTPDAGASRSNDPVSKLARDRAPVNLGAIAKTSSTPARPTLSTQAVPTTLLDAVLIETSLCEPISPSFTINLPNIVPMSPPPTNTTTISNFTISDNKSNTPQKRPLMSKGSSSSSGSKVAPSAASTSSSSSLPFPPNFAIPGPSTQHFQQQPSSSSLFTFPSGGGGETTSQTKSNNNNGGKATASGGASGATTELLELVLSPAKLGQQ